MSADASEKEPSEDAAPQAAAAEPASPAATPVAAVADEDVPRFPTPIKTKTPRTPLNAGTKPAEAPDSGADASADRAAGSGAKPADGADAAPGSGAKAGEVTGESGAKPADAKAGDGSSESGAKPVDVASSGSGAKAGEAAGESGAKPADPAPGIGLKPSEPAFFPGAEPPKKRWDAKPDDDASASGAKADEASGNGATDGSGAEAADKASDAKPAGAQVADRSSDAKPDNGSTDGGAKPAEKPAAAGAKRADAAKEASGAKAGDKPATGGAKPADKGPDPNAVTGAQVGAQGAAKAVDKKAKKKGSKEGPDVLVRGWLAPVGALISGALYFVSFAGFDVWPLSFIALVPLYVALIGQTAKRATWLGFLCGFAMNFGGFYWLAEMLKTFSGFGTPLCLFFTSFVCAYQGGRLALMGWLYGRAAQRGWPVAPVFAAAFAVSELVFPLLFPWYFAGSVHQVPILMQLADVGGPILVSLVLVAVNIAIGEVLRAKLAGTIETTKSGANESRVRFAPDRRIIGAGVLTLIVALLYGAVRISMTNARMEKADSAKVGYVQGNMGLMDKRQNPSEGLRRHRELTANVKKEGADLVIWSETSATFPTREDLAMNTKFYRDKFTASLGVPTIWGAVLYRTDPDRERWFNTALGTDAKGEIVGRYDKQFLLAFGEYLPLGDTFPILYKWSPHSGRFSAGTSLEPIKMPIKDVTRSIGVLICYEDVLPGFTNREVSHADPELLVNMTNDAWFGNTTEPWEHLALAKFRAVEHRRFLVRSTNSGVSAIIDPNGKLVEGTVSTPFKAEAHQGTIRWLRGGTVYEAIGDGPWYLITLGLVIGCFRRRRQPVAA
jgi:apolipoprotein N-acyltransferase